MNPIHTPIKTGAFAFVLACLALPALAQSQQDVADEQDLADEQDFAYEDDQDAADQQDFTDEQDFTDRQDTADQQGVAYELKAFATDLHHPWSMAFLPDGQMLVTELSGTIRTVGPGGNISEPLTGVPEVVFASQGGLSDIILDPNFSSNSKLYISYSAHDPEQNDAITLFVSSATLTFSGLEDVTTIFTAKAPRKIAVHLGAKLAFLPDDTLIIASGDAFDYREQAQFLDNHYGKLIRINADGTIPEDNPFVGTEGALADIWSYGHRNMQGLAVLGDGTVFSHEHGPRGGDEFNLIEPGKNYGWPVICYCLDYSFAVITPFTEAEGMEQPLKYWRPSIAPSGLAYYDGDKFPQWRSSFFVTGLVPGDVRRLSEGSNGLDEEILFAELGTRIRNIYQTPDGHLMILTDGPDGQLIKVMPRAEL